MIIHTAEENETIHSIAKKYNTSPTHLAENNSLPESEELIPGEELIVPIPTRTYTVKSGDTLVGIARRFGIKKGELQSNNPSLDGQEKIYPTKSLAIKYKKENLGMAAANGYLSAECPKDAFYRALPYLIYVTVTGAVTDGENVYMPKHAGDIPKEIKAHGKLPLFRIYDKSYGKFLKSNTSRSNLCDNIIDMARSNGYIGVVLSSTKSSSEFYEEYADFIFELRKKMIGSELIFITESDKNARGECIDLADGNLFIYSKIDEPEPKSFDESELKTLKEYALHSDSSKTFLDLTAHAYNGKNFIPLSDVRRQCKKLGCRIYTDSKTGISSYTDKDGSVVRYESVSCVKRKLELVGELGYMGINVDIANVPISHLVMYNTMFSPILHTSVYSDI